MKIAYGEIAFEKKSEQTLRDIAAMNALLRQLSARAPEVDWHTIVRVLHDGAIVIARDEAAGGQIIGVGTVLFGYKLTASFASIEDVVVDERYRRRGIGERITNLLIRKAEERKVTYVDLTSSPRRVAANSLYTKLGFVARETNPYRLELATKLAPVAEDKRRTAIMG